MRKYPVPPVWIWQHEDSDNNQIWEIIDGQQRLTSLYEDLKHVLGRYFEISDLGANSKTVVQDQEGDIYNPAGQNASFDYLKSNFEDFKDANEENKLRIRRAKRNIS